MRREDDDDEAPLNTSSPPPQAQQMPPSVSFITCKVQHAVQGNEMIKPLTYFPLVIATHMPAGEDPVVKNFLPLPTPPHQRHCTPIAGQRRARWEGDGTHHNITVTVERRYSELLELRHLLVLQYPMLVIPPLPQKSATDNFNTFMQSQAHLCQQQRNIARFLRELGKMPEVILFNDAVPNFFLYPRERLGDWMGRIREQVKSLKSANTSLEAHRERRNRHRDAEGSGGASSSAFDAVEESVANLASEGSKLMRGMMSSLSNWMSTPATGSTAAAAHDRETLSAAAEQKYQQHEQVQFWTQQEDVLDKKYSVLMDAAEGMMKFIAADDNTNQALFDVGEAMHELQAILADAGEPFDQSRVAVQGVSTLLRDNAEIHRRDADRRYTQVYEMLLFEAAFVEAMQDSIGFVKCLWRRKLETDLDRFARPQDVKEFQMYVAFVDDRLKTEILAAWQKHMQRMRHMMHKSVDISLDSLLEEEKKTAVHPFIVLSRTEAYSTY